MVPPPILQSQSLEFDPSATPAPRKAAANAPLLLCQRLWAALPAGIPEDSNATSPRPGG